MIPWILTLCSYIIIILLFLGNSIGRPTKSRISSVCTVVIKYNFNLQDHQCWPILVQVIVLPAKSDSDVMFCLQLLSKTLACIDDF